MAGEKQRRFVEGPLFHDVPWRSQAELRGCSGRWAAKNSKRAEWSSCKPKCRLLGREICKGTGWSQGLPLLPQMIRMRPENHDFSVDWRLLTITSISWSKSLHSTVKQAIDLQNLPKVQILSRLINKRHLNPKSKLHHRFRTVGNGSRFQTDTLQNALHSILCPAHVQEKRTPRQPLSDNRTTSWSREKTHDG